MSITIYEIDQTAIVQIEIWITYTFVWWSRIRDDYPVMLASMRYNPSNKFISHIYNSIANGN